MLGVISRVCSRVSISSSLKSKLKTQYFQSSSTWPHAPVIITQIMEQSPQDINLAVEKLSLKDHGDEEQKHKDNDSKSDHLTRTSGNTRDAGVNSVIVYALKTLSPTVREVIFKCEENPPAFTFKAGQWVDVIIPKVETVGGFSMSSSPTELSSELHQLKLAVKYSTHPPALWMHDQCKVGDKLQIRVGGDFYLDENRDERRPVLLIAGGVGINPLCSIVRYIEESKSRGMMPKTLPVCLLYSSKTENELIFKDVFDNYVREDEYFLPLYYITGESTTRSSGVPDSDIPRRRMNRSDLEIALRFLTRISKTPSLIDAYVCGPPPMITSITNELNSLNVDQVHFEQWW